MDARDSAEYKKEESGLSLSYDHDNHRQRYNKTQTPTGNISQSAKNVRGGKKTKAFIMSTEKVQRAQERARNYARDKVDTSLAYDKEYTDYSTQFRVKKNRKSFSHGA